MAAEHAALNYRDFLFKKCVLVWALACLVGASCPNHPGCRCTADYINCTCDGTDQTPLYITQSEDTFGGKEVTVSGCGRVEIQKLSMNGLNLSLLKLEDVDQLTIQSYSLSESRVQRLLMRNIGALRLESYGLSDIKNCDRLEIINATVENFPPAAVGSIRVKTVLVKDCHVGTVHSRAFGLSDLDSFTMENNYVNSFDITSVVVRKAAEFNFVRNAVTSTSFGTVSLAEIKKVEIQRCSFRQLHASAIIAKEVDSFSFHHCYVETCESRAFWSVEAGRSLAFFSNDVGLAEEDSLLPNRGPAPAPPGLRIRVADNLLTCDCRLDWMWAEDGPARRTLRETSLCGRPEELRGRRLSRLRRVTDAASNCLGLAEAENDTDYRSGPASGPVSSVPPAPTGQNLVTSRKAPTSEAEASAEKHRYADASVDLAVHRTLAVVVALFWVLYP